MADNRTEKLAQFYEMCQKKGYINMKDATQSLKAKVIATDLGLSYGNITRFYQNAQEAYETVKMEKEAEEAERARIAVDGEYIMSLNSNWAVYRRKDGTCYTEISGKRYDGIPSVYVEETYYYKYTYHGPTSTYNAISVNGITSGWVDNQSDYFSNEKKRSNRGIIHAKIGDKKTDILSVTICKSVCESFKRDDSFINLSDQGKITCKSNSSSSEYYNRALQNYSYTHDVVKMMDEESYSKVIEQLSMEKCTKIVHLLQRILNNNYPPTDEELYLSAEDYGSKSSSSDIAKAIEIFEKIADYKDSANEIPLLKEKYEEALQTEKEKAIISSERRKKRVLIVAGIAAILLIVIVVLIRLLTPVFQYKMALSLLETGEYKSARDIFIELDSFKDSSAQATKALYLLADEYSQHEEYADAAKLYRELGGYQDSEQKLENLYPILYSSALQALGDEEYETAKELLAFLPPIYKDKQDCLLYIEIMGELDADRAVNVTNLYSKAFLIKNEKLKATLLKKEPFQFLQKTEGKWKSGFRTITIESGKITADSYDTLEGRVLYRGRYGSYYIARNMSDSYGVESYGSYCHFEYEYKSYSFWIEDWKYWKDD